MTTPYYQDDAVTVLAGDCRSVLPSLPDASVDAVVTDPPYGLGFMGREWDSFAGARREGVRGGSGDRGILPGYGRGGASEDRVKYRRAESVLFGEWCESWAAECLRVLKPGGHLLAFGGSRTAHRLTCAIEDAGFEIRDSIAYLYGSGFPKSLNLGDGRGTALKPAHEPITVARKPISGTVAANVLQHGTGALNIDACRIETPTGQPAYSYPNGAGGSRFKFDDAPNRPDPVEGSILGRWPANVVLDESQAAALDEQTGVLTSGANPTRRGSDKFRDAYGAFAGQAECTPARGVDVGGASRFFYTAKASTAERPRTDDGTAHPTVKPLDLMRWLVRLVTPPGGLVLDPFLGSGTTAEACVIEGLRCIGIEQDETYLPLIVQRLSKPIQPDMFGASA